MLGGGDACLRLARLMLGGQGVPQNVNAAGMVLDLSCGSLKHGASCAELGHLMRRGYPPERRAEPAASESMEAETKGEFTRTTAPRVPRHAAVVLRSGCDLGNAPSCAALAEMLLAGEGGVSRDEREAELALETACAAKDHDACAVYAGACAPAARGCVHGADDAQSQRACSSTADQRTSQWPERCFVKPLQRAMKRRTRGFALLGCRYRRVGIEA